MELTLRQLTTIFIWLSLATTTLAADIELFEEPNSCSNTAKALCRGVVHNTCCYRNDLLFGSAGVGFASTGTLQAYARQNNNFCAVPASSQYNTPVCIITGLYSSLSGAVYRERRISRRMEGSSEFKNQMAELMTVKDGKQYIISHEKQAQIEGPAERKGGDYTSYVMSHADIVRDYAPREKQPVVDTSKQ